MNEESASLCQFSVYLKGDDLCPDEISTLLGMEPTEAHRKGKTWTTSSNKQIVEKTGLWRWGHGTSTIDVASALSEFLLALPEGVMFGTLPGVEHAYLDVFVASDPDELGGGENELVVHPDCLLRLAALAMPLQLTFSVVGQCESATEGMRGSAS